MSYRNSHHWAAEASRVTRHCAPRMAIRTRLHSWACLAASILVYLWLPWWQLGWLCSRRKRHACCSVTSLRYGVHKNPYRRL